MATMKLYSVQADRETGEWLTSSLTEIGTVDSAEHFAKADTEAVHFDTFDKPCGLPHWHEDYSDPETAAVEVHWQD